jgi:hypothetical protein
MGDIIVGHSPTSNALMIYNPRNKQYYKPDSYRLDRYHFSGSAYLSIKYDNGLFVNLLRDNNLQFKEKYPPGTCMERVSPATNMPVSGTVMDIPFPIEVPDSTTDMADLPYTILFDDDTTASIPLSRMVNLIPPPLVQLAAADGSDSLLPPFLRLNSHIIFEHEG